MKPSSGAFQSAVQESDIHAVLPQDGRREQGLQRRIGLHLLDLFGVEVEMVAVSEKNRGHGFLPGLGEFAGEGLPG